MNIKRIVKAANKLDRLGRLEDADRLDGLLTKLARYLISEDMADEALKLDALLF